MRGVAFALGGLIGAICLCAIAAVALLPHIDLHRIGGSLASQMLGRGLTLGHLHLTIADPILIDVQDAMLANADGGGAPEMARLAHFSAELDPGDLLRGALIFRHAAADGLTVVLGRTKEGVGNWRMAGADAPRPVAASRAALPTFIDLAVTNADVTMRTTGGHLLRFAASSIALRTTGGDAPIGIVAEGSYNDIPVRLEVTAHSFADLRDGASPFGVVATLTAPATKLTFDGTMTNPLHGDGVVGVVHGDMARLDTLLALAGVTTRVNLPLKLAGPIERHGDLTKFTALTGTLAGATFAGNAEIAEGSRGQPDRVGAALDISQINADILLAATSSMPGAAVAPGVARLTVDPAPGILLDARLGTRQLLWHGIGTSDLRLHLSVLPGRIAVSELALGYAGGTVSGSAEAAADRRGVAVTSRVALAGLDLQTLLRVLGEDVHTIAGRIDGGADLALSGGTLDEAVGTLGGQAVLTIARGQVAGRIMQLASSDVAVLFDERAGMTPILCFLAVARIDNGIAALSPVRLRTRDGTIVGGGNVALRGGALALAFRTLSETTGPLALDIPIAVGGSLNAPNIGPGSKDEADALGGRGAANIRLLPADLAPRAAGDGCAQ